MAAQIVQRVNKYTAIYYSKSCIIYMNLRIDYKIHILASCELLNLIPI